MDAPRLLRAFLSGVLMANATPHAFVAAVGATHLTPLAGRNSGPRTNAAWSAMNVLGSVAAARRLDPTDALQRRAFKTGVVVFAGWALASEWVTGLNG